MAKQAAATKTRSFSFTPVALTALPELPTVTRAPNDNDLPFRKEFFAKVPETVKEKGQSATMFVPKAFWETRGVDMSKVDGAYQKQKLRDQFNKWRDETKVVTKERVRGDSPGKDKSGKPLPGPVISEEESTNEKRGHYVFFAVERKGNEPEKLWTEMGLTPKDAEPGVQVIVYIPN
ncbi:hypothetical protein [Mesorhizobium sp. WSM4982]|uniref:hypothetical protein n=1 Tax=Mesorhizobium sp. WSM4982 TaxID=3038550 RepID=UPI0024153C0E|nr:hypothetical protein [Mesorhizobium sp. WSM4982]MDG4856398.1 hypothetical protein [Mesorhizobium sp. WSM4982]